MKISFNKQKCYFCFLLLQVILVKSVLLNAQVSSTVSSEEKQNSPIATEVNQDAALSSEVISENSNKITIECVVVGDPGNAPYHKADSYGFYFGAVDAPYQIGKYEVTVSQYCAFLNAVATDDPFQLYDKRMHSDEKVAAISRKKTAAGYHYDVVPGKGDFPITYVSWLEAARFCNWMHNGQPIGPEGPMTTERGAYTLDGATILKSTLDRQYCEATPEATCFIPTKDQWYKAAYYKGGGIDAGYWAYPTQSNELPGNTMGDQPNQVNYRKSDQDEGRNPGLTPVNAFPGTCSYYGAFDMAGNVWEWTGTPLNIPGGGEYKTVYYYVEGGAWDSVKETSFLGIETTTRQDDLRNNRDVSKLCIRKQNNIGFRIAMPLPQQ